MEEAEGHSSAVSDSEDEDGKREGRTQERKTNPPTLEPFWREFRHKLAFLGYDLDTRNEIYRKVGFKELSSGFLIRDDPLQSKKCGLTRLNRAPESNKRKNILLGLPLPPQKEKRVVQAMAGQLRPRRTMAHPVDVPFSITWNKELARASYRARFGVPQEPSSPPVDESERIERSGSALVTLNVPSSKQPEAVKKGERAAFPSVSGRKRRRLSSSSDQPEMMSQVDGPSDEEEKRPDRRKSSKDSSKSRTKKETSKSASSSEAAAEACGSPAQSWKSYKIPKKSWASPVVIHSPLSPPISQERLPTFISTFSGRKRVYASPAKSPTGRLPSAKPPAGLSSLARTPTASSSSANPSTSSSGRKRFSTSPAKSIFPVQRSQMVFNKVFSKFDLPGGASTRTKQPPLPRKPSTPVFSTFRPQVTPSAQVTPSSQVTPSAQVTPCPSDPSAKDGGKALKLILSQLDLAAKSKTEKSEKLGISPPPASTVMDADDKAAAGREKTPQREEETGEPIEEEEETDGPIRDEEETDGPIGREEETDGPIRDEEETDEPIGREEETDGPIRGEEETDAPIGREEETDGPIRDEEETDEPIGREEETDGPIRDEEETDEPIGREEETDGPIREEEETDEPIGREEETDGPIRDEEETDEPIGREEETDGPIRDEEETDEPIGREEETDGIITDEEETDGPIREEEETDEPIGREEETDEPIGREDGIGEPITREEETDPQSGKETNTSDPFSQKLDASEQPGMDTGDQLTMENNSGEQSIEEQFGGEDTVTLSEQTREASSRPENQQNQFSSSEESLDLYSEIFHPPTEETVEGAATGQSAEVVQSPVQRSAVELVLRQHVVELQTALKKSEEELKALRMRFKNFRMVSLEEIATKDAMLADLQKRFDDLALKRTESSVPPPRGYKPMSSQKNVFESRPTGS
ncbi:unnamed protein product [Cyprideis torosa]|uniref:Uncharacterized protein n=1 Tax=Cyprideis torosa TaxID=163714 RepID=A0A7R8WEM7_9CRUS|nr:unnamed protein product [Cyprideis torosa]CAG0889973.1 unnamed protein product [Cyprideis torosa]